MSLPQNEVLWDHLRRHYGDRHEITVDALLSSLQSEKHPVERHEVVRMYQSWEQQQLGKFTMGRRRHKSRIWLHKTPKQHAVVPAQAQSALPPVAPVRKMDLPLGTGRTATLEFPTDLTAPDVDRITDFLRFFVTSGGSAAA